ncbi:MAG TPA: pyridoxamine 5'-phosphate oxidase family protein [Rhodopila sp.]|nr:pyridoxamine 5'-phosphate oxidase family protein [Rhodopila sp.]
MADAADETYPVTRRNKVVRRPQRGFYDKPTVHGILDAALLAHIAYVMDGQPYCTPTGFWREGEHLYWHGSSASRMIRFQAAGVPVCVTVTHLDALVLARSGFHHSVNYRSVMAYGTARLVAGEAEKRRAMDGFVDRFFPGRSATLRPPSVQEIKATSFVVMEIEQASAKIRDVHVSDDEEDYALPIWTALFPVRQVLGEPEECPRQYPGLEVPEGLRGYTAGRTLDDVLLEAYRKQED